ncbi:carbon-nitrogen hydrolase family protein [Chloroflexota bacterium]
MRQIKVAAVAPKAFRLDEEYKNGQAAADYSEEAARNGAQLVCFPEGYPGPSSGPMDCGEYLPKMPVEMLRDSAKKLGIYISCSNVEESEKVVDAYYMCHKLIAPNGKILANYKRCQPPLAIINEYFFNGRSCFLAGDGPVVVDTELGKIGLIVCSELFVPELSRIEMLMGAEIILDPIAGTYSQIRTQRYETNGTFSRKSKMDLWQCVARARAAENILFVIGTANVFYDSSPWGSFIVSPEDILVSSVGEGIIYSILEMERLEYLRSNYFKCEDFETLPTDGSDYRPLLCLPAQNRDRRPEIYSKLIEPQTDAFVFK